MLHFKSIRWPRSSYQPLASLPLPFAHLNLNKRFKRTRRLRDYAYIFLAFLLSVAVFYFFFTFENIKTFSSFIKWKHYNWFHYGYNGAHIYRDNGMLEVNPNGIHPIFELIRRAEGEWEEKLNNSSRTFEDAVKEYRRRYGKLPPRGFHVWWNYAMEHNVTLPDEYDSIHTSLEPFWSLSPTDLRKIQDEWISNHRASVMRFGKSSNDPSENIRITEDDTDLGKKIWHEARVMERLELLNVDGIREAIRMFSALISPLDEPAVVVDWEVKDMAKKAVKEGVYLDLENLPTQKSGWLDVCPPDSPAWTSGVNLTNPPLDASIDSKTKKFIHDHKAYMDPCQHPTHFSQHTQFLQSKEGPALSNTLAPQFSSCASMAHLDLLLFPPESFIEDTEDVGWDEKSENRLLWRGSTTGMGNNVGTWWRHGQRPRLVRMAREKEGLVEVIRSPLQDGTVVEPIGYPRRWDKKTINDALLDVQFVGDPIQCDWTTCREFKGEFDWADRMSVEEADVYKYILDVDGNGWSSRFRRIMSGNAVIFKSTLYPEWYTDRIQPWVHYVPISIDYSEIYDVMTFFKGDPDGHGGHDDMARKIAEAAHNWVRTFYRKEDMTAYNFRMILEYARLISLDREAMTMKLDS